MAVVGTGVEVVEADLTDLLVSLAALTGGRTRVWYFTKGGAECRRAGLQDLGEVAMQWTDATRPWVELVDDAREHLLLDPAALDVGHIRNGTAVVSGWVELNHLTTGSHLRQDPNIKNHYDLNRHLWDTRVLDAHGIQLLTSRHLDHAHDLSGWTVTEVAPDGHLVEAADLAPWFAQDNPDPNVLDQARADFGDMLLTWDHIIANPGPYTIPRPGTPAWLAFTSERASGNSDR